MNEENKADFDCWQWHLGIVHGALTALGASVEVMQSVMWMKSNVMIEVEANDAGAKMDALIADVVEPEKRNRIFSSLDRAKMWVMRFEKGLAPRQIADNLSELPRDKVQQAIYTMMEGKRPENDLLDESRAWYSDISKKTNNEHFFEEA